MPKYTPEYIKELQDCLNTGANKHGIPEEERERFPIYFSKNPNDLATTNLKRVAYLLNGSAEESGALIREEDAIPESQLIQLTRVIGKPGAVTMETVRHDPESLILYSFAVEKSSLTGNIKSIRYEDPAGVVRIESDRNVRVDTKAGNHIGQVLYSSDPKGNAHMNRIDLDLNTNGPFARGTDFVRFEESGITDPASYEARYYREGGNNIPFPQNRQVALGSHQVIPVDEVDVGGQIGPFTDPKVMIQAEATHDTFLATVVTVPARQTVRPEDEVVITSQVEYPKRLSIPDGLPTLLANQPGNDTTQFITDPQQLVQADNLARQFAGLFSRVSVNREQS